ncbi:MAG: DNA mismatch repair endonuclease MutH [Legionellales bacterium]|nr:DNA mismatch repair endonuclease MutH [Legionellales bacterium]
MSKVIPPDSISSLENKCNIIAGKTIGQLAKEHSSLVPKDLKHYKGWVGQLLEDVLGAYSGSKPVPDFEHLGIELKTIPISNKLKPLESTYICTINMQNIERESWDNSLVKKKISHILWVPIISTFENISERIIAAPIFWKPSITELATIERDWHELMEYFSLGNIEEIHGRLGTFLQVRPKASNSKSRRKAINHVGEMYDTLPRGFYFRASFTETILKNNYLQN